ncbi:hypothetical protein K3495_g4988 [Podosphaera aphanis]|nr:hypothetical protein K3495_g4988 [Podosphaera aphanis]
MSSRNGEGTSPIRQVTVKILYTFDEQNKTNHLVRLPRIVTVQTYPIKSTSTIGIIDLQTCLQAMVEASPELAASTGKDYSVYAYDYSEDDTPLVGQGMLSKALATGFESHQSSSNLPMLPIIGQIVTNTTDIFSNGAKETLEVRFRLVPILSVMARDLEAVHKRKEASTSIKPNAAVGFRNAVNRNAVPIQNNLASSEDTRNPSKFKQGQTLPYLCAERLTDNSGNESMTTEATVSTAKKGPRLSAKNTNKRPRGRKAKVSVTRVNENISSFEEVTDDDGSAPKKKAKVQKSDCKTTSNLGKSSNSLTVAAGTPRSYRLLRPIAMVSDSTTSTVNYQHKVARNRRLSSTVSKHEKPEQYVQTNQKPRRNSNLSQRPSRPHILPDKPDDLLQYSIESLQDPPDRISSPFDTDTPPGMTSSPPLIKGRAPSRLRSSPPCPSSPVLPQIPRTDSGFMSGPLEEMYEENKTRMQAEDETCVIKIKETRQQSLPAPVKISTKQVQTEFIIEEECPGPMDRLPTTVPIFHQQARARSAVSFTENSQSENGHKLPQLKKTSRARPKPNSQEQQSPRYDSLSPEEMISSKWPKTVSGLSTSEAWSRSQTAALAVSSAINTSQAIPASDPVPPPSGRQRSQIWAGTLNETEINSSIIPPMAQYNSLQPLTTGNSSLTMSQSSSKKEMIRQRLEMAIANGETPPFCCNCGAIETPTWRKAWSKEMIGEPAYCEYSDEPGRVTAIIILTRDAEGKPTSYHLIKKYLGKDENQDDYNEYLLCNPCGIWMSKYKTARPEERWESNTDRSNREPKKRPTQRISKSKKVQSCAPVVPTSEENFLPSDKYFSASETSHPSNKIIGNSKITLSHSLVSAAKPLIVDQNPQNNEVNVLHAKVRDSVIKSEEATVSQEPIVKSSPTKWMGTQESPINLEDDPQDTRRLLFSSPMKDSSHKIICDHARDIALSNKIEKEASLELVRPEEYSIQMATEDSDAEILRLFGEELTKKTIKRPTTPTPGSTPTSFRTPNRKPSHHRPQPRSLSKSDCSNRSPGQLLVFSRTPGSSQKQSPRYLDGAFDSPFTATLNQLISDTNNYSPSQNLNYDSLTTLPDTTVDLDLNTNYSLNDLFSPGLSNSLSDPNFETFEGAIESVTGLMWDNFEGVILDLDAPIEATKVKEESSPEEEQYPEVKVVADDLSNKGLTP